MTYNEFKKLNESVKRSNSYNPITIKAVHVRQNAGSQLDEATLSNGQNVKIVGLLNGVKFGMHAVTNPSKLAKWRGFHE